MNIFEQAGKTTADWAIKNAPTLLTCIGAAGVILTAVASGKAAIKAKEVLDEMPEDTEPIDKVKAVAPIVAKPAFLACGTIWVIFSANKIALRRNAALVAAYTLTSRQFDEYKEKVEETIGKNKSKKIKDAIAEDTVTKNPPPETVVFSDEEGMTVCFDKYSGRYFKADIETIRKVINDINDILIKDGFVALNEFYERLGLSGVKNGEDLGWNVNYDDLVDIEFSSQLTDKNVPVLVLDFRVDPKEYYDSSF